MSFTFHHLKSGAQGPEGWPGRYEHLLLLERTRALFPEPVPGSSQVPVTPVSRGLTPSAGLSGHLHTRAQTNTQTHTIYTIFKKGTMFSISLCTSMLSYHSSQIYNILITSERNSKPFSDHLVSIHPTL